MKIISLLGCLLSVTPPQAKTRRMQNIAPQSESAERKVC